MSIIIPRHLLYLIYLCPCLDLGLFMSYLCNPIFICIFIFTDMLLLLFIFQNIYHYYFWMITWMENIVFKQQMFSLRVQHLLDFFSVYLSNQNNAKHYRTIPFQQLLALAVPHQQRSRKVISQNLQFHQIFIRNS